jgi:hypothetical protein
MNDGETRTEWKQLLEEVLTETDIATIEKKAQELENVLFIRAQEIHMWGGTDEERQGMKDATNKLLRVKIEKLGYPIDPKFLSGGTARKSQQGAHSRDKVR